MMVPLPERGRIYRHQQRVGPADVGPTGAAHLDALARWLQEAAFADALDAGLGESAVWVIRRTLIGIDRLPEFAEQLTLRTFCSGIANSVAERRTSISGDRGAAVEAEAIWVQVDPETRMPARFSAEFLELYSESADGRRARSRLRHPPHTSASEAAVRAPWTFRAADLDIAGHVNNAVYWQIAEQHLAGAGEAAEIEVEFRGGAEAGEATLIADATEGMLWVLGPSGEPSASIRSAS
jgi:acyl-ACP thioesterase